MIISDGQLVKSPSLSGEVTLGPVSRHYPLSAVSLLGYQASYAHIYRAQSWVYVVINKRAKATARLPLKVYRRNAQGREEVRDHPYAQLLRNPNPRMSPVLYWSWMSSMLDIFGEAMAVKVRGSDRRPAELWPLHPASVDVEEQGGQRWYVRRDNPETRWSEDDVIHHRTFNPASTIRGLSPLEPLRQTLANEDAARRATSSFWSRGARPGMALSHPQTLSEAAGKRLKAQFDAIAAGADNTGTTVVLEEGMKPEQLTLSAEEAQYIETRKLNREEVCAAYDMPPTAVGILDHATYSNISEQLRSVYRDTMAPHLRAFEADLALQLEGEFDGELYAEFLMDEVLRGDFEVRQEAYRKADYMTIAEKRELENLPFIEGTDRIVINAASIPLDQLDAVTESRAPASTVRTVMGRLSRVKSINDINPAALTEGLNGSTPAVLNALDESKAAGETVAEFRDRIKALEA